jgi:hypothetical protein
LANGETSGTVTQGVTQNLVTTITDTNHQTITGLSLDYQSTDPVDISATTSGAITASFPGVASVYAVCQPGTCNPSPINILGQNGTGLSLSSNPVTITTPGSASQYVWFGSPGLSQYFVPVELLTGTIGSSVRLPYVPNSMLMDKMGTNLFFGSEHELMIYSAVANTLSKQDTSAPGVVLAASPNSQQLLINDQVRQKFYLYAVSGGSTQIFGGMGTAAAWTPDSKTLYIVDSAAAGANHTDRLYVYNVNTGWSPSIDLSPSTSTGGSLSLAITIPGVGAYLSGSAGYNTVAHTWCPTGTITSSASTISAYYPQPITDSLAVQTDVLAATTDGAHILGAAMTAGGVTLSDIGVSIPTTPCTETTTSPGVQTLQALSTDPTLKALLTLDPSKVNANITAVNQVVASPQSSLAFLTYTDDGSKTGATLPYYVPGSGVVNYLSLTDSATPTITAPLAGAFAPDNSFFFVSTAGDNKIHYISVPDLTSNPSKADTQQISPNLPACTTVADGGNDPGCTQTGTGVVPATVIVVRPRSTT